MQEEEEEKIQAFKIITNNYLVARDKWELAVLLETKVELLYRSIPPP